MYTAEISRKNPGDILLLLDLSSSMNEPFGGDPEQKKKAKQLADVINERFLLETITWCTKEGSVRHYFDLGIIGYRTDEKGTPLVESVFTQEPLKGKELIPIDEIYKNPLRFEERIEEKEGEKIVKKRPIWFDPIAEGGTPMCEALRRAAGIVDAWVKEHPKSFPPIVINVTDGMPTDDPDEENFSTVVKEAERLKGISTEDGNTLLFNLHISSQPGSPVLFPNSDEGLPDKYARMLFQISSILPESMINFGKSSGMELNPNARGFVFNGDMDSVYKMIDIGTRVHKLA